MKFKFYGNGNWYRTEKKLAEIDKKEADSAYRKCKKEILDPFMKSKGFIKWGTTSYVKLNEAGIIENVFLQKERYGCKTFTVNLEFAPLYIPYEYDFISLHSHRLSMEINGKDFWWDFKDCETAEKSFENVVEALDKYGLKYLENTRTSKGYIETLKKSELKPSVDWGAYAFLKYDGKEIASAYVKWYQKNDIPILPDFRREHELAKTQKILDELEAMQDVEAFFRKNTEENCSKWKLPKGLLENQDEPENTTDVRHMEFEFYGGLGRHYRTQKSMARIDKKQADSAYRKYKRKILDPYMQSKGFLKCKGTSYVRINETGVLERVFLEKDHYGYKKFTVHLETAPIYVPNDGEHITSLFENLGLIITKNICEKAKDFWWDFKDGETAEKSFENIVQALEMFGMQYFEDKRTPKQYIKWAMWYNLKNQYFPKEIEIRWKAYYYLKFYGISKAKRYCRLCQAMAMIQPYVKKYILTEVAEILNKLDNVSDVELFLREITEENIEKGKLPKGLLEKEG